MKLKPVEQQVAVIVGASSGIGRETAHQFAQRGAKVVAAGRSQEALDQLSSEIRSQGGEAAPYSLDVANYEQVRGLADYAVSTFGRIDTWVHLAAVAVYAKFTDTSPEEFRRIVEVNLLGQVHGAMAALPHLKRNGRGALIHISSVEARQAIPLTSAYTTSKHGMVGFLDALRMELEHEGENIAVTNILPASINTPFYNKALTRLGVMPRPIPPVYEPEAVVEAILYAAEHPVREMFVGGAGKGLSLLHRVSPRLAERAMRDTSIKMIKSDRPKPPDSPNNLYHHIEGYDKVHGDFSREAREKSTYTMAQASPVFGWAPIAAILAGAALFSIWGFRSYQGRSASLRHKVVKRLRKDSWIDRGKRIALSGGLIKRSASPFRRERWTDRILNLVR